MTTRPLAQLALADPQRTKDGWIELAGALVTQNFDRLLRCHTNPARTSHQRIVGIGHGHDARASRDGRAPEAQGKAAPVEALL